MLKKKVKSLTYKALWSTVTTSLGCGESPWTVGTLSTGIYCVTVGSNWTGNTLKVGWGLSEGSKSSGLTV